MARILRKKVVTVVALAIAAIKSPAIAIELEVAWNNSVDVKGCDGNWHRIPRPRNMRQCVENGSRLHCTPAEMKQRTCHHYGQQRNDPTGQPQQC